MRTAAQAEMVLDENSEAEVVISYLSDLLQQAQTQQTEQERIVYHQTFLNLPKMVNNDLALAQEEVSCPSCLLSILSVIDTVCYRYCLSSILPGFVVGWPVTKATFFAYSHQLSLIDYRASAGYPIAVSLGRHI